MLLCAATRLVVALHTACSATAVSRMLRLCRQAAPGRLGILTCPYQYAGTHKHFDVVVAGFVFVTKLLLAVWCDTYSSIGAVTPEPIPPAPSRRRLPLWEFDTGPVAHPHRHGLFVVMLG